MNLRWLGGGCCSLALALALCVFLFWLAHRSAAWRAVCAHSLLALVALQVLLQVWAGLIGTDAHLFTDFMSYVTGLGILLLSLLPAAILHHVGAVFTGLYGWPQEFTDLAIDAGLLLACQLILITPLALLARDAVRRYRGGSA